MVVATISSGKIKVPKTNLKTCSVETGVLVFAIISGIIAGFFTIIFTIGTLGSVLEILGIGAGPTPDTIPLVTTCLTCLLATGLNTFFSLVLCRGILQKQPSYVLAHFQYGVGVTVISILVLLVMVTVYQFDDLCDQFFGCKDVEEFLPTVMEVLASVTFVYMLILIMVWKTYKKLKKEVYYYGDSFDKKPLVEKVRF